MQLQVDRHMRICGDRYDVKDRYDVRRYAAIDMVCGDRYADIYLEASKSCDTCQHSRGGESIYGEKFADENLNHKIKHSGQCA